MKGAAQGLSQDFKIACPTQQLFQNDPFNPFLEPVFAPPTVTFVTPEVTLFSTKLGI